MTQSSGSVDASASVSQSYSVEKPLDITSFLSRPCDLLPGEALQGFGVKPGTGENRLPEDDAAAKLTGPYCSWPANDVNEIHLSVGIQSGNTQRGMGGLDGLRVVYEQGRLEFWEDTSVAGYPAAYTALTDRRAEGRCEIAVGIANDMSFTSIVESRDNPQEACRLAQEAAAEVIEKIEGGL